MDYTRQTREQRPAPNAATDPSGAGLTGPVGLRGRTSQVKNSSADQQIIIDLIAAISRFDGGMKEAWGAPPLAGPSGQCPRFLSDAIWDFQSFWKSKGVFQNIDGVVDPGGNTYKQLIRLARGGGRMIPNIDPPDKADGLLGSLTRLLAPRPSNLSIADVQLGIAHSATVGKLTFLITAGKITVTDAVWPGSPKSLSIKGLGGSWGKVISSASNAPAVGKQIHVDPGKSQQLGVHQLCGKCLLINAWSGKVGYSTTTIIFNVGPQISIKYLDQGGIHVSGPQLVRDATHSATGFATVISSFSGSGGSISIIEGLVKQD